MQHLWATGGHRSRLSDLKTRRGEVERITRVPDPRSQISGKLKKSSNFKVLCFGMKIELTRLQIVTSHCAAPFAMILNRFLCCSVRKTFFVEVDGM